MVIAPHSMYHVYTHAPTHIDGYYPAMFKILDELVEIPINDRLIPADRRTRGGHNQAYKHIRANTTLGHNSFWHRTIPDWNSLPAAAIESKTVAAFKSQLVE